MTIKTEVIEPDNTRVHVMFAEVIGQDNTTITGWPEAAEDLDLLGPGPKEADGIKVLHEVPRYYDEEEQEHVAGYTVVVLAFDSWDHVRRASSKLYDKATERFEWGMADEGQDVQTFAGAIPSPREVAP